MHGADVAPVEMPLRPGTRQVGLGAGVVAPDAVAHAVACATTAQRRNDGVIGGNLAIGYARPKKRELEVLEFFPVDHDRLEIDIERADAPRDIGGGNLRVPAVVQVNGDRPQSQLLHLVGDIGAVDAAADADRTVIRTADAVATNLLDARVEDAAAFVAADAPAVTTSRS